MKQRPGTSDQLTPHRQVKSNGQPDRRGLAVYLDQEDPGVDYGLEEREYHGGDYPVQADVTDRKNDHALHDVRMVATWPSATLYK